VRIRFPCQTASVAEAAPAVFGQKGVLALWGVAADVAEHLVLARDIFNVYFPHLDFAGVKPLARLPEFTTAGRMRGLGKFGWLSRSRSRRGKWHTIDNSAAMRR